MRAQLQQFHGEVAGGKKQGTNESRSVSLDQAEPFLPCGESTFQRHWSAYAVRLHTMTGEQLTVMQRCVSSGRRVLSAVPSALLVISKALKGTDGTYRRRRRWRRGKVEEGAVCWAAVDHLEQ